MEKDIRAQLQDSADTILKAKESLSQEIEELSSLAYDTLSKGNKLLLAGNGGSATQASHIAAEFTGRYKKERPSLPAISLTTDIAAVTAISNDYGYEQVFSRQLEGLGKEGDLLIALSTSGNSENLIKALEMARKKNLKSVSLLGKDGGKMKGLADLDLIIPSDDTPRVQECHILLLHIMCDLVERRLFP